VALSAKSGHFVKQSLFFQLVAIGLCAQALIPQSGTLRILQEALDRLEGRQ
jgi:hypothetical protein